MEKAYNKQNYLHKKQKFNSPLALIRIKAFLVLVSFIYIGYWFKDSVYIVKLFQSSNLFSIISNLQYRAQTNGVYEPNEEINSSEDEEINLSASEENSKIEGYDEHKSDFDITNNSEIVNTLETYIKNFKGQYGIYYYNLATNEEFGINHEYEYTAASTIKIPLNLYLYTKISTGEANPKGTLTYLKEDFEEGTGKLRYEKHGKKYSLEELSMLSIVYSDNISANMLFRFLGKWNVKDYMRKVGGVVVSDYENLSSPKDMGLYMKLVYEFYIKDKKFGKQLMDCFLNTIFNDRLPAGLPDSVKVAHKIGSQVGTTNDIGIVFTPRPYILSVMSKDIDEEEAPKVISEISKKVFESEMEKE